MEIHANSVVKKFADCKPGDFVRLIVGASCLTGIVSAGKRSGGDKFVAILEETEFELPYYGVVDDDVNCLCYDSWVLELDGDEFPWPRDREQTTLNAGVVRRDVDGDFLILSADGKRHTRVSMFDLKAFDEVPRNRAAGIPVASWRIWANESHRLKKGAKPLFCFDAMKKGAT